MIDKSGSRGQNLHYRIFLINQTDSNPFNRAMLFNIGFIEAMKEYNWTCIIFHDVDLIPEDDRNIYRYLKNIFLVLKIIFRMHFKPTAHFGGSG